MPKVVDKQAKKMEILHAAMKVFARKGVVKTVMTDIAEEAAIGKGTIYEYFRSKEEIFCEAFNFFFTSMTESISDALKNEAHPIKQLEVLVKKSLDVIGHGEEDFAEIMMDFWAEGVRNKDEELLKKINLNRVYQEYRTLLKGILESGINKGIFRPMDVTAAASVFIGAFDGIMLQWILERKAIQLDKVSAVLLDSFIEGIRYREG